MFQDSDAEIRREREAWTIPVSQLILTALFTVAGDFAAKTALIFRLVNWTGDGRLSQQQVAVIVALSRRVSIFSLTYSCAVC